jgi:hypothetical protein
MTPELTQDQRVAIEERHGMPVYVLDPATNNRYVLMLAEDYEKMKAVTEPDEAASFYPMLADLEPEDWEDASNYEKQP